MKFPAARQVLRNKAKQVTRLVFRIKTAELLNLRETDFKNLIQEVEDSELFRKLRDNKAIKFQQFPHIKIPSYFYELNENIISEKPSIDVSSCLYGREELVKKIRNLGIDGFRNFFLGDNSVPDSEIASQSGLGLKEISEIKELIETLFIYEEMSAYPVLQESKINGIYYSKIASIVAENNEFVVNYTGLSKYRLKYVIDYDKIRELKKEDYLAKSEVKELGEFLRNIELINDRKSILHKIIESIINFQTPYLKTNNPLDLKSLTQRELSRRLCISPSSISRVIRHKSIETPRGDEKPLDFFLQNKKTIIKMYISDLVSSGIKIKSDRVLKEEIEKKLKIIVSRRSITLYRNELRREKNDRLTHCSRNS